MVVDDIRESLRDHVHFPHPSFNSVIVCALAVDDVHDDPDLV
jgi:hypothetical protein